MRGGVPAEEHAAEEHLGAGRQQRRGERGVDLGLRRREGARGAVVDGEERPRGRPADAHRDALRARPAGAHPAHADDGEEREAHHRRRHRAGRRTSPAAELELHGVAPALRAFAHRTPEERVDGVRKVLHRQRRDEGLAVPRVAHAQRLVQELHAHHEVRRDGVVEGARRVPRVHQLKQKRHPRIGERQPRREPPRARGIAGLRCGRRRRAALLRRQREQRVEERADGHHGVLRHRRAPGHRTKGRRELHGAADHAVRQLDAPQRGVRQVAEARRGVGNDTTVGKKRGRARVAADGLVEEHQGLLAARRVEPPRELRGGQQRAVPRDVRRRRELGVAQALRGHGAHGTGHDAGADGELPRAAHPLGHRREGAHEGDVALRRRHAREHQAPLGGLQRRAVAAALRIGRLPAHVAEGEARARRREVHAVRGHQHAAATRLHHRVVDERDGLLAGDHRRPRQRARELLRGNVRRDAKLGDALGADREVQERREHVRRERHRRVAVHGQPPRSISTWGMPSSRYGAETVWKPKPS